MKIRLTREKVLNIMVRSVLVGEVWLSNLMGKGRVLDIGSGKGDMLGKWGKKVFGIDINGESLKASYGKGHKVIEASAVNLPFRSGSFGTVISINVIEHLAVEDAFKMLCEILRVLKPGGIFILKTELATDKFWNTFSHIRPYPPSSIIKMINENSEETFSKICDYKHVATIYEADIKEASLSGHIRNVLCQFIPLLRRSYIMILGKET